MTKQLVRIALIGLDHWYSCFPLAEEIAKRADAQLVAIADPDPNRAQTLAQRVGVERVTVQPEELLDDPTIDVVASFISVDRNPDICIAAARSGKHILSIKPLARTVAEATGILTAVREAGVVFLPAESRARLADYNRQLKQWIAEGRLGRVLTATFSLHSPLPQGWPGDSDPGWFANADRAPGGGWIDHSIYYIDLLRWLLEDEVQSVFGVQARLKYPDLPVEDYGLSTVVFGNGLIASLEVTWLAPPQGSRSHMSIVGSEGALALDSLTGRLSLTGNFPPFDGWVHTQPPSRQASGLDHLIACVRGEASPIATVEDAWRNLAACRAFYEAADAGTSVAPADIPAQG